MMGRERVGPTLVLTARRHGLLKLWGGVTREFWSAGRGNCNITKLSEVRHKWGISSL